MEFFKENFSININKIYLIDKFYLKYTSGDCDVEYPGKNTPSGNVAVSLEKTGRQFIRINDE